MSVQSHTNVKDDAKIVVPVGVEKTLSFGRTVVPVVNRNRKADYGEYAEHCFTGDAIKLTLADGQKVAASDHKFELPNGLTLTYGQINGLAGDFYGTDKPISDGSDVAEQSARFVNAYNTLAEQSPRQPKEAVDILAVLQAEVDAVNEALKTGQDPSIAYSKLPSVNSTLQWYTWDRPDGQPSYLGLASINWDHFGADARTAYDAGHGVALQKAIDGDLEVAYAMNAFADHFLEDSFSAGHLRTPRRLLHDPDPLADICAKYMHDEDNAIGLSVKNPAGESWAIYGDKRVLDKVDGDNEERCVDAVQASADEIYDAYTTKLLPPQYKAWTHAPTLESANADQTLKPLFTFNNERRKVITNRREFEPEPNWSFAGTWWECSWSGWWDYPITIDGPTKVLVWSSVAASPGGLGHIRVFYQNQKDDIYVNEHLDGKWVGESGGSSVFKAVAWSPLASISWKDGNETRVYYLDKDYILQEHCYTTGRGWYSGGIGSLKVHAIYNTGIAAVKWEDAQGPHARVYLQESGSNAIKEFVNDGAWVRGATLPAALKGSSIAAVTYVTTTPHIRIFYQAEDLSLKEYFIDGGRSYPGKFNPGKVPGGVPISAVGWNGANGIEVQVYWRNSHNEIVQSKNTGSWGPASTVLRGLKPGTHFAAAHWENGKHLKLYHQDVDDSIIELYSDGDKWVTGFNVANSRQDDNDQVE